MIDLIIKKDEIMNEVLIKKYKEQDLYDLRIVIAYNKDVKTIFNLWSSDDVKLLDLEIDTIVDKIVAGIGSHRSSGLYEIIFSTNDFLSGRLVITKIITLSYLKIIENNENLVMYQYQIGDKVLYEKEGVITEVTGYVWETATGNHPKILLYELYCGINVPATAIKRI